MAADGTKTRSRRSYNGCVSIKITTRRSDRLPQPVEPAHEFRVDEQGALMLASAAQCTLTSGHAPGEGDSNDLVVGNGQAPEHPVQPQWQARINYDPDNHSYWFCPLESCPAYHAPCTSIVPSRRRDIFVRLGDRGQTTMSWPLQAGDGFRIGHTYVVVLRVLQRVADGSAPDAEAVADVDVGSTPHGHNNSPGSADGEEDEEESRTDRRLASPSSAPEDGDELIVGSATADDGSVAECCFCYEPGSRSDPLMRACRECKGSVQYVHLSCLRRWSSPQGSGRVPAQCPTCKRDLTADVQEKLVMPPALLLEVYWSHHRQRRCQWVTFAARNTVTIGKMEDNDVVIPDHTVSRRHARIEYTGGKFILHDSVSSRGTFAPVRSPLRLAWGQEVVLTVGKSTLVVHPRQSWFQSMLRWLPILNQGGRRSGTASGPNTPGRAPGGRQTGRGVTDEEDAEAERPPPPQARPAPNNPEPAVANNAGGQRIDPTPCPPPQWAAPLADLPDLLGSCFGLHARPGRGHVADGIGREWGRASCGCMAYGAFDESSSSAPGVLALHAHGTRKTATAQRLHLHLGGTHDGKRLYGMLREGPGLTRINVLRRCPARIRASD
eukprot:CAMPEP_0206007284 /NCGR_PEP_ID=MMETSP1464-20131121/5673_1 /ASSEMBLY_ACC=CAM_ASM_001124 /TAXON_ID=119497 /ORGANISM="Exanthemachrysis gayraliae, Strain RCC1523" /LENGTH=607 /DNA_ID=CAMNT_0053380777 /DNA_START=26 /DNA_END=1850 /DNA_ORIENTATION=+